MDRIGFILECFPSLTETFVRRELEELRNAGVPFCVYALRPAKDVAAGLAREDLVFATYYAPGFLSARALAAQLIFLVRQPHRYFAALLGILATDAFSFRSLVSALKHFPIAVALARRMSIDGIIHIHAHFANLPATLAYIAAKLLSIPFSFSAHARDIYVSPSMLPEKLRSADFVVTCCAFNRDFIVRRSGCECAAKIHVVYHGVNPDKFSRTNTGDGDALLRAAVKSRRADGRLVVSVGRFVEKKGFRYLLEACARLRSDGVDIRCVVVGAGNQEHELRTLTKSLQITDMVELVGTLSEDELVRLYSRADIAVLPCVIDGDGDHDGIPNTLVEAMAMEVATITTSVGGIPELISDGDNGIFVPQRNAAELAYAIKALLSDDDRRHRLTSRGRATILERFDIRKNVRPLIALFDASTCRRGPGASEVRPR